MFCRSLAVDLFSRTGCELCWPCRWRIRSQGKPIRWSSPRSLVLSRGRSLKIKNQKIHCFICTHNTPTERKESVFTKGKNNPVCASQSSLTRQQVVQVAVVEAAVEEAGERQRGGLSLTQTNKTRVYILWGIRVKMWASARLTETRQLLVRTVVWRSNSKLSTWVLSTEVWWAWIDSLVAETSWKWRTMQLIIHQLIYDNKSHFALAWSVLHLIPQY